MGKFKDLTGQTFGRLTVLKRVLDSNKRYTKWLCRCECGNEILVLGENIKKGRTKSCGCLYEENKHRKSKTRLYRIWSGMKNRCNNSKSEVYNNYGGRGIKLCSQWESDFNAFSEWAINNGYKDNLSIDRIDVNRGYCPENCRWTTFKVQNNNRRSTHAITYKGKTQSIKQWAEEIGINPNTLEARIVRYNWSIERALNEKTNHKGGE